MGALLRFILPADLALDLTWYGVYFGVLGRDCAEVAADRMVRGREGNGRTGAGAAKTVGMGGRCAGCSDGS
jgi:hypothetical protein